MADALHSWPKRTRRSVCATMRTPARRMISGMGELHLEVLVDRMLREFNVQADVGKPQVAYRETITQAVRSPRAGSSVRRAATGSTAHVVLEMEPLDQRHGHRVRGCAAAAQHPARVHPGDRRPGIEAASGGRAGGLPGRST